MAEMATADLIAFIADLELPALPDVHAVTERYPLDELVMPLSYAYPSVAAGTNFKEHAEEIYSDDPPFLFPKLVEAGRWNEGVPYLPRLDFEAELCMFPHGLLSGYSQITGVLPLLRDLPLRQ